MTKKFNSIKKIIVLAAPLAFFGCYPSHAVNQQFTQNQKTQKETVKILQKLTQYAIDESFLINQCIDNIKNQELKDKLLSIKSACEDNIQKLSTLGIKYGGEAVEYSEDFKGYFMEGYAAMRGAFTDQGALKALHTNLKLILKAFESPLNSSSLPKEVKETIQKAYEDNKEALHYIDSQI